MGGWSKGLTKETDARVAKISEGCSRARKGKHYPYFTTKGRPAWNRGLTAKTDERVAKQGWSRGLTKENNTSVFITSEKLSNSSSFKHKTPAHISAIVKSRHKKPNKSEFKLQLLLDSIYPNFFHYNEEQVIGTIVPDFISGNGYKLLIELFGNYWHSRNTISWHQTELGRIMISNFYGYKCLVIWESELKDIPNLIDKIKVFVSTNC